MLATSVAQIEDRNCPHGCIIRQQHTTMRLLLEQRHLQLAHIHHHSRRGERVVRVWRGGTHGVRVEQNPGGLHSHHTRRIHAEIKGPNNQTAKKSRVVQAEQRVRVSKQVTLWKESRWRNNAGIRMFRKCCRLSGSLDRPRPIRLCSFTGHSTHLIQPHPSLSINLLSFDQSQLHAFSYL